MFEKLNGLWHLAKEHRLTAGLFLAFVALSALAVYLRLRLNEKGSEQWDNTIDASGPIRDDREGGD
jgi:hypothetical protein